MNINYTLDRALASQQRLSINMKFTLTMKENIDLLLPAWRPGRYERGNFAANILALEVKNGSKLLKVEKTSVNTWHIRNCPKGKITVSYEYFSKTINAGSTYLDEEQLYVNPVNCLFSLHQYPETTCTVQLKVPDSWKSVGMLPFKNKTMIASSYDELYDSPFVSSASLNIHRFKVDEVTFSVVIQGDAPTDPSHYEKDFKKFIRTQFKAFGGFPVKRYCFLIQATPQRNYHGVEHEQGTVIALGPARQLFSENVYQDLLGVSSHELYHTWNVKYMRPEEMWPYNFSKENYHRIGYIIEGITTYQGDLKLWQSGVMSDDEFFVELNTHLDRHVNNFGRFNMSVRESSFDLWVDGYGPSIPDRKVSIYTEGALIALMMDIHIIQKTKGKKSLDSVMRALYKRCMKSGRAYSEDEFLNLVEKTTGVSVKSIISKFADKATGYEKQVQASLKSMGLIVEHIEVDMLSSRYGIRTDSQSSPKVISVHPSSEAYKKGLRKANRIIGIDDYFIDGNVSSYIKKDKVKITFRNGNRIKTLELKGSEKPLYTQHQVNLNPKADLQLFNKWKKMIL